MKPENAIEVNHISKKFKVYMDKGHTLKEKMLFSKRRKYEERIVLDDISFEVKKGDRTDRSERVWEKHYIKASDQDHVSGFRKY